MTGHDQPMSVQVSDDADIVGDDMATKGVRIQLRISDDEGKAWRAAAKSAGLELSEWIRRRCNGAQVIELELPPAAIVAPKKRGRG